MTSNSILSVNIILMPLGLSWCKHQGHHLGGSSGILKVKISWTLTMMMPDANDIFGYSLENNQHSIFYRFLLLKWYYKYNMHLLSVCRSKPRFIKREIVIYSAHICNNYPDSIILLSNISPIAILEFEKFNWQSVVVCCWN
jgi:hypothetical protein